MEEPEEFSLGDDNTITNKVTKESDEWKEVDGTEEEKKQELGKCHIAILF